MLLFCVKNWRESKKLFKLRFIVRRQRVVFIVRGGNLDGARNKSVVASLCLRRETIRIYLTCCE